MRAGAGTRAEVETGTGTVMKPKLERGTRRVEKGKTGTGTGDGEGSENGEGRGRGGELGYPPHQEISRVEDQAPQFLTRHHPRRQEVAPAGSQQLLAQDPAPAR